MSRKQSPREIRREVTKLKESDKETATDDEISVLWGTADPENRPDGVTWVSETGTITYDLWDAQRETLEALQAGQHDVVSFLAGYGSGKTLLGARWLLKQAIDNPDSTFLAMGIDFTKAKSTTFKTLFSQLPGERTATITSGFNGPENSPLVQDYNRQEHRIVLTNDTEIILGSADRWNRYAGLEVGDVWLDEPAHYGSELFDLLEMLGSRLRGTAGSKQLLFTTTGNGQNAAFDILERGVDSDGEPLGLNTHLIRASTLDNPYLDESDKERFERQFGNTSREAQALHGGFAAGGGSLLSLDQLTFIHEDDLEDQNFRYRLGVDLSYVASKSHAQETDSDYTAVVCSAVDPNDKKAYLIDLGKKRGMTLRESINWIGTIASGIPDPEIYVEDVGAQTFWIQEARDAISARIHSVTPSDSKEDRITDMSILFERGDALIINRDVDDNLGYDPHWRPFVREWVQFGSDNNSPDLLDAAYYALHELKLGNYGQSPTVVSGTYHDKNNLW